MMLEVEVTIRICIFESSVSKDIFHTLAMLPSVANNIEL